MNMWGRHVAGSGARTLSFVDDRTFWSSDFAQLEAAKTRSEEFDRLFNSSVRLQKVILRVLLVQQVVSLLQTYLATRCLQQ